MARSGDPLWCPLFDTHFHPEFLFPKEKSAGNLRKSAPWKLSLLEARHPYPFPNGFMGGLSIWCHPTHYPKFRSVLDADRRVYAAVGCHPHFVSLYDHRREVEIGEMLSYSPRCSAWGEMGLDYNRDGGRCPDPPRQRLVFASQLQAAVRRDLPIVIHGRDAEEDLLKIMKKYVPHNYPSIHRHCVTSPPPAVLDFLKHFPESKFGFTNKVTRPGREGSGIRDSVKVLPLHKILTETDSPWHPPSGWRPISSDWRRSGRGPILSHPGMVDSVVDTIASVKNIPYFEAAQATYRNACSIFRL